MTVPPNGTEISCSSFSIYVMAQDVTTLSMSPARVGTLREKNDNAINDVPGLKCGARASGGDEGREMLKKEGKRNEKKTHRARA